MSRPCRRPDRNTFPSLGCCVLASTYLSPWVPLLFVLPSPIPDHTKMQAFRISKQKVVKSSKPAPDRNRRRLLLAEAIAVPSNEAMVSCTQCVSNNVVCYYNREQSVKCAECLKHCRECDGTFSLEEFRKVGEQRDQLESKALVSQRELVRLRELVAKAEAADLALREQMSELKDKSSRMLRREMQALGVMETLDNEQVVALGDPAFSASAVDSIDWEALLQSDDMFPEFVG